MLAFARKNAIREQLQENKSVQITTLAELLQVTKETIRRDLRDMEQAGELIRTHGGAYILDGVQNDIDVSTRRVLKTSEKKIIAQKCNALIQTGDYIFLDGSTTAWFIAQAISLRNITVLTNSLEIANQLSTSQTVRLFVVGGQYSASSRSFTGNSAIRNLENYYVDKAIISCRSVSMESGLTDTNDNDAMLHRLALSHASERYLAVDHSKVDKSSFSYIAPISELNGIIMDRSFSDKWVQHLTANKVQIY